MIPVELEPEYIQLPETDQHTMVIITGTELRHRRFAYRLQQEFGEQIVAWYEFDGNASSRIPANDKRVIPHGQPENRKAALSSWVLPGCIYRYGLIPSIKKAPGYVFRKACRFITNRGNKRKATAEQALFAREIEGLKKHAHLNAIKTNPRDIHHQDFISEIKKHNPYFFLSLGGPLYKKPLLESIRGVAINQHAGHSPDLKGTKTTEWALYHRHLDLVSSTVHITSTGADSGHILRRSNPYLFPGDDLQTIFERVVALGTELMIESVQEIINNKKVVVFKQPKTLGKTCLGKDFSNHISQSLDRDFNAGWLRSELDRLRNF